MGNEGKEKIKQGTYLETRQWMSEVLVSKRRESGLM